MFPSQYFARVYFAGVYFPPVSDYTPPAVEFWQNYRGGLIGIGRLMGP